MAQYLPAIVLQRGIPGSADLPAGTIAVSLRNNSGMDIGVTFSVGPPAGGTFRDVVPAFRERLVVAPNTAYIDTPQGRAPGAINTKIWLLLVDNNIDSAILTGSPPLARVTMVAYQQGDALEHRDAELRFSNPTVQDRFLVIPPGAHKGIQGVHTFAAAGSFQPAANDFAVPYPNQPWDGVTNGVVVYLYSFLLSCTQVCAGRLQAVETGGSGLTYDLFFFTLAANQGLPFCPASAYPVSILPSNGTSQLSLQITLDSIAAAGDLRFNVAIDGDSRNSTPVPAIGYGELAGNAAAAAARAVSFW